jgi:hypothetical protein
MGALRGGQSRRYAGNPRTHVRPCLEGAVVLNGEALGEGDLWWGGWGSGQDGGVSRSGQAGIYTHRLQLEPVLRRLGSCMCKAGITSHRPFGPPAQPAGVLPQGIFGFPGLLFCTCLGANRNGEQLDGGVDGSGGLGVEAVVGVAIHGGAGGDDQGEQGDEKGGRHSPEASTRGCHGPGLRVAEVGSYTKY